MPANAFVKPFMIITDIKKSINTYRTGIRHVPESIKLHHNVAIALWKQGEKEKARKYSRKAEFLKQQLELSMGQQRKKSA